MSAVLGFGVLLTDFQVAPGGYLVALLIAAT
jgi:hypothetical protein